MDEINEINDKHYIEHEASFIKMTRPSTKETYSSSYKQDYSKASADFWKDKNKTDIYNQGHIIGTIGNNEIRLSSYFDRLFSGIKEIITSDLRSNKQTSESLKNIFSLLQINLKLLEEGLKSKETNVENLLIMTHGFINGWIESINEKVKHRNRE